MLRFALIVALLPTIACPAIAGSSNSLLDVTPDGTRILVANTDAGSVAVVDVKSRKRLHEIPVGDHPEGVAWVGNGPLALVTLWGDDRLAFIDADSAKLLTSLKVDDEPYGVVVSRDGTRAFVSHDYPGTVSEIDIAQRKVLRTFAVGSGIRGIALSHDEHTLYLTEFFTAKLIALDIATGKVIDSWLGGETDNLCRQVTLHPKWEKAYFPHLRSRVNTVDARGSIFGFLTVCDISKTAEEPRRRPHPVDSFNGVMVAANPWEVAVSPDGTRLYVIYAGTDDLNYFETRDDSYRDVKTLGFPRVGKHPRAIRVSPDSTELYIANTLDHEIGIYDKNVKKLAAVKVCEPTRSPAWQRGKELFVSARQPMGAIKWVSCSSCHPDGLTDARVWQNPEGDRRTPHLFALAHTHPLHWSADRDEVQDFEYTIRGKLMRGRGLFSGSLKQGKDFDLSALSMDLMGKSADLDALALYTNSFQSRLSPHAAAPGKLTPEAERGRALFFSKQTQCATCHTGPYFSDSTLKAKPFNLHDVGTGDSPREKMGPKYDTPTLIGVYRMGPYLHDGRAKTLHDVLTTCNANDKHGKTSHLKPTEIDELVAFLKSLPYEPQPDRTPNTVPHDVPMRREDREP